MRTTILILVVLLSVGLAHAQQPAEPGTPEVTVTASASVTVASGYVAAGSIRLPVQKILHPRPLTDCEDKALREYMADRECDLRKSGNYEATEASIRLLLGIEQAHLPLAWRPKEYMAYAQIVWQMLKYLETYVNVPIQEQKPALVLPPFLQAQKPAPAARIEVCATVPVTADVTCKETRAVCGGHSSCAGSYATGGAYRFGGGATRDEHMLGAASWSSGEQECSCDTSPGTCPIHGHPPTGPGGDDVMDPPPPCGGQAGGTPGNMSGVPSGYSGSGGVPPAYGGSPQNPAPPATPGNPGPGSPGLPPGSAI